MRRAVAVTHVVLGCDACGLEMPVHVGDSEGIREWQEGHRLPVVNRLLVDADCACPDE